MEHMGSTGEQGSRVLRPTAQPQLRDLTNRVVLEGYRQNSRDQGLLCCSAKPFPSYSTKHTGRRHIRLARPDVRPEEAPGGGNAP